MEYDNICERCGKGCHSLLNLCWKCKEEKEIESLKEEAIKNGEINRESFVICPYCGSHYGEDEMHETTDVTCWECNKEFHVEVEYDVSYSTSKSD